MCTQYTAASRTVGTRVSYLSELSLFEDLISIRHGISQLWTLLLVRIPSRVSPLILDFALPLVRQSLPLPACK